MAVADADAAASKINRSTLAAVAAAIRLGPDRPDTHFTAGYIDQSRDRKRSAVKHYRRALEIDPTYRPAIDNLAGIAAGRGNLGVAIAAYVGMLASDPGYQRAVDRLRSLTRIYLGLIDLVLAFLIVLVCVSFRSLDNQLRPIVPGYAHPGETLRVIGVAIALLGFWGFYLAVRHRAGEVYFNRYVRSLSSIGTPFVVWAIGLGLCVVAMIVAIFVGSTVAVRIYEFTTVALGAGFVIGNVVGRLGRWESRASQP